MKYKTYEKYKDSNIEWIGEIPEHWNVNKLKFLLDKLTDGSHSSVELINEGYPYVTVADLNEIEEYVDIENCKRISKEDYDFLVRNGCKPTIGDILFSQIGTIGLVVPVDNFDEYVLLSSVAILTISKNIDRKWLIYFLKSLAIKNQWQQLLAGGAVKRITLQHIANFVSVVPFIEEQKQIAYYLDEQTSKIDATIAKNEELIQLLEEKRVALINQAVTKGLNQDVPMKDSGVEWIGEIPKYWEKIKLKNCTKIINDKKDFADENDKYVGLEHIESETGRLLDYSNKGADGTVNKFKKDMVLFGKLRPYLAKVINPSFDGVCSTELLVFKTEETVFSRYLFYFMLSNRFIEQVNSSTYGVKMPRASPDFINSLPIVFPSANEQKEIVDYLDSQITNINDTISKIQENIALLEEYKISLIHHVVTGKIDVRGEEI